jgi:hypothetical protein
VDGVWCENIVVPELKLMRRDQVKETLVKYNGKENGELK